MPSTASRRTARHLMWALPLLTGVAGYGYGFVARPVETPSASAVSSASAVVRPARYAGDPAVLFAETLMAIDPPESSSPPPTLSGLDSATLKQRLLELLASHGHPDLEAWAPPDPFLPEFYDLAQELGRQEGAAGLAWIEEHLPELRLSAMNAWAKQDPAAAFASIAASDRLNPCTSITLMELLGKQGEAGPDALLAALDRVPWHLFTEDDPTDPFYPSGPRFELPASTDVRLWADSGALRHLAEEGIWIPGALGSLAKTDPALAMAEWSARPPTANSDQNAVDLREILTQAARDDAQAASLKKLLTAPGGYAEDPHFREMLTKMSAENSGVAASLRTRFPGVFPESVGSDPGTSSKP